MAQELIALSTVEKNLAMLEPHFAQVLAPVGIPAQRLMRTILISVERQPKLLECTLNSLMQGSMTAACLGLEVDGVTGQGFLIPFKDKGVPKAQFVVGYKGYNTMAARSNFTINCGLVREGDTFDFQLGTSGYINHKPLFPNAGKIRGAWAIAQSPGKSPIIGAPISIDDLMKVMQASPAVKYGGDTPWKNADIGFPAMCEKTAKRRLARAMPLNTMVMAAAMEEAHEEMGAHSFITPDKGIVIDGQVQKVAAGHVDNTPPVTTLNRYTIKRSDGTTLTFDTKEKWLAHIEMTAKRLSRADLAKFELTVGAAADIVEDFDHDAAARARKIIDQADLDKSNGGQATLV